MATSSSIESPPQRLVVPKAKGGPLLPICGRVLMLALVLMVAFLLSCTWYSMGYMWAWDTTTNSSPISTCPGLAESFKLSDKNYAGPTCEMSIAYNFETATLMQDFGITVPYGTKPADALNRCILPHLPGDSITCYSTTACTYMCRLNADNTQDCPDPETLQKDWTDTNDNEQCDIWVDSDGMGYKETVDCYKLEVAGYCTETFTVTPSNVLAMRGILFATLFIVLFWLVAECCLRSVDKSLKQEQNEGMARMELELPAKKNYLRAQVVSRWSEAANFNYNGPDSAVSSYGAANTVVDSYAFDDQSYREKTDGSLYRTQLYSRDPKRRFESQGWQRRLAQWKNLGTDQKKSYKRRQQFRSFIINIFFIALIIVSQWCILYFSPQHLTTNQSMIDALKGVVSIWEATSVLDWLIFIDVMLDIFLFLLAVCVVKWPRKAIFAGHLQDGLKEATGKANGARASQTTTDGEITQQMSIGMANTPSVRSHYDDEEDEARSTDTETIDFVLEQAMTRDVCLMIACHKSTMTLDRFDTFTETLRSALMVFPPSHIFVCDNGPTIQPFDETQWATQQVHPDINYVYIPEGNKTFAFYWVNKYWVPFLQRNSRIPDFKYAVIIDDDVPLPADLHIPHQLLDQNPHIKAVHFPITAATPSGKKPLLVSCQDVEYKMAAVHKMFQATLSRPLSCHGAIALWDRDVMDEVFYEHDTVFNGEDLYMGLSLLRKRDSSKIISCAQAVVPTYAPDNWGMLFRQRVKSWDVTSHKKTFTYLLEIVNPAGWCHMASWVLKPYFLQELLTIILDWLRMFLLFGLLLRDWISLVLMSTVFTILLYVMVLLFQWVVLRARKDLKVSFCTIVMFPWYRLSSLLFRLGALCQNILIYSHERTGIKIRVREDEIRDIPPCPPHYDVDWFSVWTGEIPVDTNTTPDCNTQLPSSATTPQV